MSTPHDHAQDARDIEASRSILHRACASADPFPDPLLAAAKITANEIALRAKGNPGGMAATVSPRNSQSPLLYRGARSAHRQRHSPPPALLGTTSRVQPAMPEPLPARGVPKAQHTSIGGFKHDLPDWRLSHGCGRG
jgi:hypothetical protein